MLRKMLWVTASSIAGLTLLLGVLLAWPLPETPRPGVVAGDFLMTNVTVVDVQAGILLEGKHVVVREGRIASVGSAETAQVQRSLITIDGTGKFLMPGLWDMHTHSLKISPQYNHLLFIGTDAGDTYVSPGFSIHDELVERVSAGLTPADALRSATIDAARFSRKGTDFGSIETGKVADMILLSADPLTDIRNTRQISALLFSGMFFDRAALDQLLAFAGQQANSIRTNLHLLWYAVNSPIIRVQLAD